MGSENAVIRLDHVSMRFNMSRERVDSIKEYIIKLVKRQLFFDEFWALRDVSFEVAKGEVVGIIGLNGAGKSTLLKLVAGVLKPSSGTVTVQGSIAPLIELGAGFDPELTAKENVYMNGAVLGYATSYMKDCYQEIIEFSELEDFADVPIKNFSSGMYARLAFAVATIVKPDVLIVDEILGVGDFRFQQKCHERISDLMSGGTTVLMVSHANDTIRTFCNRVAWLENGRVREIGPADQVCDHYEQQ